MANPYEDPLYPDVVGLAGQTQKQNANVIEAQVNDASARNPNITPYFDNNSRAVQQARKTQGFSGPVGGSPKTAPRSAIIRDQYKNIFENSVSNALDQIRDPAESSIIGQYEALKADVPFTRTREFQDLAHAFNANRTTPYERQRQLREAEMANSQYQKVPTRGGGYTRVQDNPTQALEELRNRFAAEDRAYANAISNVTPTLATNNQVGADRFSKERIAREGLRGSAVNQGLQNSGFAYGTDVTAQSEANRLAEQGRQNDAELGQREAEFFRTNALANRVQSGIERGQNVGDFTKLLDLGIVDPAYNPFPGFEDVQPGRQAAGSNREGGGTGGLISQDRVKEVLAAKQAETERTNLGNMVDQRLRELNLDPAQVPGQDPRRQAIEAKLRPNTRTTDRQLVDDFVAVNNPLRKFGFDPVQPVPGTTLPFDQQPSEFMKLINSYTGTESQAGRGEYNVLGPDGTVYTVGGEDSPLPPNIYDAYRRIFENKYPQQ